MYMHSIVCVTSPRKSVTIMMLSRCAMCMYTREWISKSIAGRSKGVREK